jgi:hypothetical protein
MKEEEEEEEEEERINWIRSALTGVDACMCVFVYHTVHCTLMCVCV